MSWHPQTPEGFISVPVPPIIRKIVPRRFGTHFFLPVKLTDETKDKAILCISRDLPGVVTCHVSSVVSRSEVDGGAGALYERFIVRAIEALDNRVGKAVAA